MTWIRHNFEIAMNKFLSEAAEKQPHPMNPDGKYKDPKEVETKCDNSGYEKYLKFFKENEDLFEELDEGDPHLDKQRYKIDPKTKERIKYKSQGQYNRERFLEMQKLEKKGMDIGFPFGRCYPVTQFMFYVLGGYEGMYWLRCMNELEFEFKGIKSSTSHWYLQHKNTGRVVDLTRGQFDQLTNFSIDDLYQKRGRIQNLGHSAYQTEKGKVEFKNTVPCFQVLRLYDRYRELEEQIPGLEKYWSAANYATERRSNKDAEKLKELKAKK